MAEKNTGRKTIGSIEAIPFRGGVDTVRQRALIDAGGYSMIQNMRQRHPGMEKRSGCAKHHSTADTGSQVVTLYQFSKGKSASAERHFFGQFGDNDILEATNAPPYDLSSTGVFGTEIFSSTGTMLPISWSHVDDVMIMSDGVDQHKLYAGTANYVKKFVKFVGSAAPPSIPSDGFDYTQQVTDGSTTTSATLNSLNTIASFECLYVCTPIPASRLTWTMGNTNATAATGTLKYWASDGTWTDTTETDGTISSSATLGQTGSMTWTPSTTERPRYMFGVSGFWYQWETNTQLDSTVSVTSLTYGTDGASDHFVSLTNVWDGVPDYAIEARFFDNSASIYYTFSTDAIEIDSMTSSDKVYFNYPEQLEGMYIDVGSTPNTTSSTTINSVYCWNGTGFAAVTILQDETNGMANSGWVTWKRPTTEEPTQFQNARYYSYWYYFTVDQTLNDDVIISIETMPYFDISELGISRSSHVWKDRACYTFDRYPQYMYFSAKNEPLYLNGDDYGILQAGDGRANDIVCVRQFHNELLVWQEEKGIEGGCLTLFEGNSPATWGKLILSSKIGSFNAKSAVVVDGVLTSTATEEVIKTLAFFISHYGVCVTDGRTVSIISDYIQNYFDPTDTTHCIRRGYESEMWIAYDSAYNVLRLGLVTGTSATKPNTFPVFDLTDKTWSFDNLAQELSCMCEVEAASGNLPILQYGGGTDDGFVYQLNTGTNDVSTAIDGHVIMEISKRGAWLYLRELLLRCKVQSAGNITVTPYRNGIAGTAFNLVQTAETTNDEFRRHRIGMKVQNPQISLKLQNATTGQSMYLLDIGMDLQMMDGR